MTLGPGYPPLRESKTDEDCICGKQIGVCDAHEWLLANWMGSDGQIHTRGMGVRREEE